MIQIEPHPEGVILPVRAAAGSRQDAIRGAINGELKVAVSQAPEQGKANRALRDLLARKLDIRKAQIELLSGETSPHKRFLIRGIDADALLALLAHFL